jgi:AcrR family transcriptional regulator
METLSRREREKLIHEGEIIQAAENIFRLKGYENTSMEDIAKEAQFTKRTLYQYFPGKEDLFFAVLQKGFQKLQSSLQGVANQPVSGYIKLQQLCQACYQFFLEYPELFRLVNSVGYARQNAPDAGQNRQDYLASNDALFHGLAMMIAEGQADGSINPDLDAQKASLSLVFLMTGFFNQLAVTGKSFSAHFSTDVQDFSLFTMDLILRTLKK